MSMSGEQLLTSAVARRHFLLSVSVPSGGKLVTLNVVCSLAADLFSLGAKLPSTRFVTSVVLVGTAGIAFAADFGDSSDARAVVRSRFEFGSRLLGRASGFARF